MKNTKVKDYITLTVIKYTYLIKCVKFKLLNNLKL